jgi:hypothetical protein
MFVCFLEQTCLYIYIYMYIYIYNTYVYAFIYVGVYIYICYIYVVCSLPSSSLCSRRVARMLNPTSRVGSPQSSKNVLFLYEEVKRLWTAFIFSSHFHTKTIHCSIIGDSQPSVQPWAIPRLHFHESCSYSLQFFTQKQYICWLLGFSTLGTARGYTQATLFHKMLSLSLHFFTQKQYICWLLATFNLRYSPGLYPVFFLFFNIKCCHFLFAFFTQKTIQLLIIGAPSPGYTHTHTHIYTHIYI